MYLIYFPTSLIFFIIFVPSISDLHSSFRCRLSGSSNAASGIYTLPLARYDNRGILASPLILTACLVKVVKLCCL